METKTKARVEFGLVVMLVYVLPPLLIAIRVISFDYRFAMLVVIAIAVLAYERWRGASFEVLGIRKDTFKPAFRYNLAITLMALVALFLVYFKGIVRSPTIPQWHWFFAFYVLVSCPAQELLFRSSLFVELDRAGITNKAWQIAISAVAFSFLHVIYRDPVVLAVALLMGLVWGFGYSISRNLWAVTLSHSILGTVSIFVGLI